MMSCAAPSRQQGRTVADDDAVVEDGAAQLIIGSGKQVSGCRYLQSVFPRS
jgi:hypothetical protein